MKQVHRISAAAREAMRESGRTHAHAMLSARLKAPVTKQISAEFEQSLLAQFGATPTPAQLALCLAATASYTGTYIVLARLRTAYRYRVIEDLLAQLTPLQGGLLRCLRALGLTLREAADDSDPANMSPEARREWARKYVEDTLAKDRSTPQ